MRIAIVGAGPAGLYAAETAAMRGAHVTIYERMPSPARKFLLAGRGGLNLTHVEDVGGFRARYGAQSPQVAQWLDAFTPGDLRAWADSLGAETFIGTSGRIFPKAMKASPLLRAWLTRLARLGVTLKTRWDWQGFAEDGGLRFATPDGPVTEYPDAAILALGGASWPRLGADGRWAPVLEAAGVAVAPLEPANCGLCIAWSDHLRARFAGSALKSIALTLDGERVVGEAIVTAYGMEGGAIYRLAPLARAMLTAGKTPTLTIDLKPQLSEEDVIARLNAREPKRSWPSFLERALKLSPAAIALVREAGPFAPETLAANIKRLRFTVTHLAGMDRAISTAGGVKWESLTHEGMLKARPGVFAAGEMIDWEAPTGGYLLQACFASGKAAALGALAHAEARRASFKAP